MSQIQVPNGWKEVSFEDISKKEKYSIKRGPWGSSITKSFFVPEGYKVYQQHNVIYNDFECGNYFLDEKKFNELKEFEVKSGDFLISCSGTIGKIARVPKNTKRGVMNQALLKISVDESKIDSDFFLYLLNSPILQKKIRSKGSAMKNIVSVIDLKKIKFNIPERKELQKKIVQKLDYILEQFGEKKKKVFELVEHKNKNLLLLSKKTIGTAIVKEMKLDNPPTQWIVKKISEVCSDIQPGFAQGEKNVRDGTIHLRMNNIGENFEINFGLVRLINATDSQISKYSLEKGDILFNNTNSIRLVGKSAIFGDIKQCLYSNHLTRLRVNKKILLPEWLLFYLRTRWLRRDFERMCNKWVNQAAVNNTKIKNLEIPIPPSLSIQKNIISNLGKINDAFKNFSQNADMIIEKEERISREFENLKSSFLNEAFTGKLVN